jgi:hypothetical protein
MSELLPCPFCGDEPPRVTTAVGETWVSCVKCLGSSRMYSRIGDAIEAWNLRPLPADMPAMIEGGRLERAAIVAWLRAHTGWLSPEYAVIKDICDAIEGGDHLKPMPSNGMKGDE